MEKMIDNCEKCRALSNDTTVLCSVCAYKMQFDGCIDVGKGHNYNKKASDKFNQEELLRSALRFATPILKDILFKSKKIKIEDLPEYFANNNKDKDVPQGWR